MPRSNTASDSSVTVNLPTGLVTFTYGASESDNKTIISIPEKSPWTTSLHWHEHYDEYFRVLKGRVRMTVGNVTRTYGPDDRVLKIKKFVEHEFMRADAKLKDEEKDAGPVEVMEWSDPDDGFHEVFFRNVFSVIKDSDEKIGLNTGLQLLIMIDHLDNYVVLIPGPVGYYCTHAVYSVGRVLGKFLGYRTWYKEYTPARLHAVAASGGARHEKDM